MVKVMNNVVSLTSHKASKAIRETMVLLAYACVDEVVVIPYTEWELRQLRTQVSANEALYVDFIIKEVNSGRAKFKETP